MEFSEDGFKGLYLFVTCAVRILVLTIIIIPFQQNNSFPTKFIKNQMPHKIIYIVLDYMCIFSCSIETCLHFSDPAKSLMRFNGLEYPIPLDEEDLWYDTTPERGSASLKTQGE